MGHLRGLGSMDEGEIGWGLTGNCEGVGRKMEVSLMEGQETGKGNHGGG